MAEEESQTQHTDPSPQADPETERKARDIGWQPKEMWKGEPEKWVDAQEFLRRGETFVPFLRHERTKLKAELDQTNARTNQLQEELKQTRETLEALKTFNSEMAAERKERRKVELGAELRAAREAGDDVKVAELTAELADVVKPVEEKPPARTNGGASSTPVVLPWVKNFLDGNKEFFESTRKVALFNAIMLEKRQAGDTRVGEIDGVALLNEAREEVERALGGNSRRQAPSKTEESRSGGSQNGSGNGKSYFDLPAEARAKCDAQEARFVGEKGKLYKTQAEWRAHYARDYFG